VVGVIAFFFIRGMTVEPPTPRPNLYGGPKAADAGGESYPGQHGGGAQTPLNPAGGSR
jgi:hypothetical protein